METGRGLKRSESSFSQEGLSGAAPVRGGSGCLSKRPHGSGQDGAGAACVNPPGDSVGRGCAEARARQELDPSVASLCSHMLPGAGRAGWAQAERGRAFGRGWRAGWQQLARGTAGGCQGPACLGRGVCSKPFHTSVLPRGRCRSGVGLCRSQQSRAVVTLCVTALSRTENKLCQLLACPVMMLCLSTALLRSGCLPCREETRLPLPPPLLRSPLPADRPRAALGRGQHAAAASHGQQCHAATGTGPAAPQARTVPVAGRGTRDGAGHRRGQRACPGQVSALYPCHRPKVPGPVPADCPTSPDFVSI